MNKKQQFIDALARFLTDDLVAKSNVAQASNRLVASRNVFAPGWQELYQLAGLQGWATPDIARVNLKALLGP